MIAGRYRLVREIARGGMGVVWLGTDEVLGRTVALKRIGMVPGATGPDVARATREARLAAALNHPHVVAIFDQVDDGDEHWLVMEYVEGATLADLVKREGPMPPDRAAPLLAQAADAVAAAHAAGIIHRDVKPSNLLVTSDGRVKITDFGIARMEADATLTQTGLVTGSPAYLAPEVASGRPATEASDVWSLGATLFHALAGRPPYDMGGNLVAALYKIVHEEPPRLEGAGWLAPLLESTMVTDPADRWSMEQVRDYLKQGVTGVVDAGVTAVLPVGPDSPNRTGIEAPVHPAVPPDEVSPVPPSRAAPSWRPPLLAVLAGMALVMAIVLASSLTDDQPKDGGRLATPSQGTSPSTPGESSGESPGQTADPAATEQEMNAWVRNYLATVTSDTKSAWEMLTPAFQKVSRNYGSYQRFWNTIASAEVADISADATAKTVTYTVDYVRTDGSRVSDTVTLRLRRSGDSWLIAGES